MIDAVVLHVETAHAPHEVPGGAAATDRLGVACAALYEYAGDRFVVFGPDDRDQLRHRLQAADWVTGFNPLRWDYPLLWGQSWDQFRRGPMWRPLAPRVNDLVRRLVLAAGQHPDAVHDGHDTWSLDALGRGTVGRARRGTGLEAPQMHREGNWPAAASYALDACALVRDLNNFVERYGYLVHADNGAVVNLRGAGPRSPFPDNNPAEVQGLVHDSPLPAGWLGPTMARMPPPPGGVTQPLPEGIPPAPVVRPEGGNP